LVTKKEKFHFLTLSLGVCFTYLKMQLKKLFLPFLVLSSTLTFSQKKKDSLLLLTAPTVATETRASSYIGLAKHYRHLSPKKALNFAAQATVLALELKSADNLLSIAQIKHDIFYFIGDYEQQMKAIKEAILLLEKQENKKNHSLLFNLLASAYYNLGDYPMMLQNYQKSLDIATAQQDTVQQVRYLNAVGYAYRVNKNNTKALTFYNKGLLLQEKTTQEIPLMYQANLLGNSGLVYIDLENYPEALRRFRASKKIRLQIQHLGHIAGSNLDIAELYQKQKKLDSAVHYNKEAIRLVQTIKGEEWMLRGYKNLSAIYEQQGNYKEAFFYKKKEDAIHTEMLNKKSLQKQSYLQAEIAYEKQVSNLTLQKTSLANRAKNTTVVRIVGSFFILVLIALNRFSNWKNKEIKNINSILLTRNKEKETLLKEVHHRVKNNLQTISSILSLQAKTIEDPLAKKILLEGTDRIKSMSLVHQRLYEKGRFNNVTFKDYATQVIENLISSYSLKKSVTFTIDSVEQVDIDFAITLGLILNEVVTNSLKYNTSEKTPLQIDLSFVKTPTNFELNISDNGIGFNTKNIETKKTLGIRLINILTQQLEGTLQLTAAKNKGAHYSITIPVLKT